MWEKNKLIVTTSYLFLHNVLYRVDLDLRFSFNFTHIKMSAISSNLDESKILSSAKGLDGSRNEGFSYCVRDLQFYYKLIYLSRANINMIEY